MAAQRSIDVMRSGAGNPHRNPLRNLRKRMAAAEELRSKDGLDAAQKKKLQTLKAMQREASALEKRWRAWEKKAKREWRRAMKRDKNKVAGILLAALARLDSERRRADVASITQAESPPDNWNATWKTAHTDNDLDDTLYHTINTTPPCSPVRLSDVPPRRPVRREKVLPIACLDRETVRLIHEFIPRAYKIAPPPPRAPLYLEIAVCLSMLAALAGVLLAYFHFPVQAVVVEAALLCGLAAAYYLDSSHIFQLIAHISMLAVSVWLVWRGSRTDTVWMGVAKSFPSLLMVALHYFSSLFLLLSSYLVVGFIPFAGPVVSNLLIHTYLPIQSCYTILLSLMHSTTEEVTLSNGLSFLYKQSGLLVASPKASYTTWTCLLLTRMLLVTHPILLAIIILALTLVAKTDEPATPAESPTCGAVAEQPTGDDSDSDADDAQTFCGAALPEKQPPSRVQVMRQWLFRGYL
ncbi:hypothetical protein DIPPA_33927 [Diplonema papillatum]|nr:hypothetical protein DIPPA_33927 [Diplonema papillatum]|eukprot:gene2369-3670_t